MTEESQSPPKQQCPDSDQSFSMMRSHEENEQFSVDPLVDSEILSKPIAEIIRGFFYSAELVGF